MSIVRLMNELCADPWGFQELSRPLRLLDQNFGLGIPYEDMFAPIDRTYTSLLSQPYYRPWRTLASTRDAGSTVSADKDKFQIALDVQHFKPEEIKVSVADNAVTVSGKHEERKDEHGYISREFTRRYVLPKDYDMEKLKSSLSSDGVLSICAPRVNAIENGKERTIPIETVREPAKAVKDKK